MSTSQHGNSLVDALGSLARAREAAETTIRRAKSPDAAFKVATDLAAAFRAAAEDVAGFRAREAARLRDSEGLSLAELAKRLGISKPRADQLIRMARAQRSASD